jgi:hypothetical protein
LCTREATTKGGLGSYLIGTDHLAKRRRVMNKLTIAKIYLGLLALGLVILGFLFPVIGLPMLIVLVVTSFSLVVDWVLNLDWDN